MKCYYSILNSSFFNFLNFKLYNFEPLNVKSFNFEHLIYNSSFFKPHIICNALVRRYSILKIIFYFLILNWYFNFQNRKFKIV